MPGFYVFEDKEYILFSLNSSKNMQDICLEKLPDKIDYIPVVFLDAEHLSESSVEKIDKKIKETVAIDHFGVKGLSIWVKDEKISSAYVHKFDSKAAILDFWSTVGTNFSFVTNINKEIDTETQLRTIQAFGEGTTSILSSLCVGVVGASGTGSLIIEMLYRTGVGELVIADPDTVEEKNLNRILNTSLIDAKNSIPKVDVLKKAISNYGFTTKVEAISKSAFSYDTVKSLSRCDVIFGCTDTADSRALLNDISRYYCIPYIDIGIRLSSDSEGITKSIVAAVNYVSPNGKSLENRRTITSDEIYADTMRRTSPEQYEQQVKEKYIKGANVESPAVMCVNMLATSFAFLDFMSRLHCLRADGNSEYERVVINYTNMLIQQENEEVQQSFLKNLGKGDVKPLLGKVELSEGVKA